MIDLHCHILPGLDDGPKTIQSSIEMARQAANDGIHTIVATPHIKAPFLTLEKIELARAMLQSKLTLENIPIRLLSGGDVDALADPKLLKHHTINSTPYILVEFPYSHWPSQNSPASVS
jgi:protein-tyrosine phosphatase